MNNDEIITKANDFYEKLNGQRHSGWQLSAGIPSAAEPV